MTPQNLEDATIEIARQRGYDTVQIKHPGEPVSVYISQGEMKVYAEHSYKDLKVTRACPTGLMYQLLGTWQSESVLVHDCVGTEFEGEYYRLNDTSYKDRYALARVACRSIDNTKLRMVTNYPIAGADALWPLVAKFDGKGLIFRKSIDKPHGIVLVHRYYPDLLNHLTT